MREILFRGKDIETRKWVYGYYVCFNGKEHRIYSGYAETDCGNYYPDFYRVIPETVEQYTGLTDKNGNNKIFEGDILIRGFDKYLVKWNKSQCRWSIYINNYEVMGFNEDTINYFEVIGNIHDNPELLKGGME